MMIGEGWWSEVNWRQPWWLLLALQPLLIAMVRALHHRAHLNALAPPDLLPWVIYRLRRPGAQRLLSRDTAYALAWCLFAIAAAGPRLALNDAQNGTYSGADIIAVVDVSRSMQARDIAPWRLHRARIELQQLLQRATRERIGLIVFSGQPHLVLPPTTDREVLRHFVHDLERIPLPTHGSDAGAALRLALETLSESSQGGSILLITDGDWPETALDADIIHALRAAGASVFVLAVATEEGEAIPLADGSWLSDANGPVTSRMNRAALERLARDTNGQFAIAADDDSDWRRLHDDGMAPHARVAAHAADSALIEWQELYVWPLVPAILLLFVAAYPYTFAHRTMSAPLPLITGVLLLVLVTLPGHASASALETAYGHYQQQQFSSAAEAYATIPGYTARMGQGASLYRLDEFAAASTQFSQAVFEANDDAQRAAALFNLANSYFQTGNYDAATRTFRDVLRYRPQHQATTHNLALSEALLQLVNERTTSAERTGSAGAGPRTATAEEGTEVRSRSTLTLDDSEPETVETPPLALADLSAEQLRQLLVRGLRYAQVVAGNGNDSAVATRLAESLVAARLHMQTIEDAPLAPWKALFEREEGFIAPLKEPRTRPGVTPW